MIAYVGIDAHTTNYTVATRMEGSKDPLNVNTYSPAMSNIVKYCKAIRKEYGKDTEIVLGYYHKNSHPYISATALSLYVHQY